MVSTSREPPMWYPFTLYFTPKASNPSLRFLLSIPFDTVNKLHPVAAKDI